jgi:excisionase family DNA binding protein
MASIEDRVREIVREELAAELESQTVRVERHVVEVNPQRLYAVAKAAALLGVSTDYVYDRIKPGELAATELGHGRAKQRISAVELQRFIDARSF